MYMLKFLEEMFWESISKQSEEKVGEFTLSLLKNPNKTEKKEELSKLLDLYFSMTKFGVKYTDTYKPSDKYVLLKDSSYAVSKEFMEFFHISTDAAEMNMTELYDTFISCLLTEA